MVSNVGENRAFFEKYFGFRSLMEFPDKLAVLTDGAEFSLVFSSPEIAAEIDELQRSGNSDSKDKAPAVKKPIEYPAGFHIGFHQDSREAVDEIYKKLKDAGVAVEKPKEYHGGVDVLCASAGRILRGSFPPVASRE